MGYVGSFMDNQSVGATMMNAVANDLVGEESGFADGVAYGVDDLNNITKDLIGKGIKKGDGEECRVTVSGSNVTILSGLAFFESGAKLRLDAEGATLPLISDATNYVWLSCSTTTNEIAPKCTTAAPPGDYVELAEVTGSRMNGSRRRAGATRRTR